MTVCLDSAVAVHFKLFARCLAFVLFAMLNFEHRIQLHDNDCMFLLAVIVFYKPP